MSHLPADCARDEIIENYQFLHDVFIATIILPLIEDQKIEDRKYVLFFQLDKPHRGATEVG